MALICPPCSGDCHQGRYCPARVAPIRRAVAPLRTEDGGHTFNGGISFPVLSDEEADEPVTTPDVLGGWAQFGQTVLLMFCAVCIVIALAHFLSRLPPL